MKKLFLLSAAVLAGAATASAEVPEPMHFSNSCINRMAPNGTLGVSKTSEKVQILDLVSGKVIYELVCDYDQIIPDIGVGNLVSNTGIVLLTSDGFNPEYWKDGKIYTLDYPWEAEGNSNANGITPDGKRICGYTGVLEVAEGEDILMNAPCYWDAEGDDYSTAKILPYPERDFTGRVPQYVMCNYISEDGKTIIGVMQDGFGGMAFPIRWVQNNDGEWTYDIVGESLYKPEGIVFPPYPGEGPDYVDPGEYMTEEELEAYYIALNEWWDSGDENAPQPNPADFISNPEMKEAYLEAAGPYNQWMKEFSAWSKVYDEYLAACPNFQLNSFHMSLNGKYVATTEVRMVPNDDPFGWSRYKMEYIPCIFDMSNNDQFTLIESAKGYMSSYVSNDGIILATSSDLKNASVIENGNCTGMKEWIESQVSVYGPWMEDNMLFPVYDYVEDPATGDWIETVEEVVLTGVPTSTPDLAKIGLWIQNDWDYSTEAEAYLFDIQGGITGVVGINAETEGKVIYDLSGRQLREISAPGIYVVNGKKVMVK